MKMSFEIGGLQSVNGFFRVNPLKLLDQRQPRQEILAMLLLGPLVLPLLPVPEVLARYFEGSLVMASPAARGVKKRQPNIASKRAA